MPDPEHYVRAGGNEKVDPDLNDAGCVAAVRDAVEPWLSAVLQSEHLALLLGNGFTTAVAGLAQTTAPTMDAAFSGDLADQVETSAAASAARLGRDRPNVEDRVRAALALIAGMTVLGEEATAQQWRENVDEVLRALLASVLACENGIDVAVRSEADANAARTSLVSFLLTFASRAASRERLNLFTTNYDRLVEYGCDLAGLRPLDRFVGALEPVFRASRLDVDMHYNPPGIRGEPRYLEGVLRLTKIHGSLDWRWDADVLRRVGLPFGAPADHPAVPDRPGDGLMIYPNPAKDVETLEHPYAELFRDFSAALCRPNSALVVYGYGFGDDHVNRVIADMLTIPSTHLVIISYDWSAGRLRSFLETNGRDAQISLLVGPQLADLKTLVGSYLPKPAIDTISVRRAELLRRREAPHAANKSDGEAE
ncbi:MAG: SIR2 family protein, partial [Actinomycetota bacterium]|nr:SIR2 family protein [Actinomycetota bacterium]